MALAGKNVVVTNTGPEDSIKLANQLHYQAALDECVVKLGPDTLTKVGTITFI